MLAHPIGAKDFIGERPIVEGPIYLLKTMEISLK